MKKLTKVLSVVMITIMMVSCFSSVFAAVSSNPEDWTGDEGNIKATEVKSFMNSIINIVSLVGSAVAIIALIILGIKYMMGSAEEKAEYKKTLLPYVIGAVLIFAASNLASVIYNMAKGV